MNDIFKTLKTELEKETKLPVFRDYYAGDETAYITVNIFDERPAVFGDGDDELMSALIDVDLWCRSDPTEYKRTIRRVLREQEFAIESINSFYESAENYNHINFRCEKEEEV